MKSVRNRKVANSSFLSNHDLLQNFRNKSFKLITRESSFSDLKQVPKKISLIQKKNYQPKGKENKENEPLLSNKKAISIMKGQTQRQKPISPANYDMEIQKVIKELNFIYDQISTEEIQLKMILNKNIRKIKELFSFNGENASIKSPNDTEKQLKQKVNFLSQKIEQQSKKIFKYKKECEQLKDKSSLYQTKIETLQQKLDSQRQVNNELLLQQNDQKTQITNRSQNIVRKGCQNNSKLTKNGNKLKEDENKQNQIQLLQNIIQTQQELIQKQMTDFEAENQQFLRLLQTQALQIESTLDRKQNNQEKCCSRQFSNEKKSTAFQSRYNSNSSTHFNSINHFSSFNSPLKTEDLIANINKKKVKQGDFSICLY